VCPGCRTVEEPSAEFLAEFGPYAERLRGTEVYRGTGCDHCLGTGYRGRCGVFELMPTSPELVALIERRASSKEVEEQAVREGMQTLMDAGMAKALAGETSLEEVREQVLVWEKTEERAVAAP
jgi:general secretion pathway protein E